MLSRVNDLDNISDNCFVGEEIEYMLFFHSVHKKHTPATTLNAEVAEEDTGFKDLYDDPQQAGRAGSNVECTNAWDM